MMTILIVYIAISIIVGIKDLIRMRNQADYFNTIPYGDIGEYEVPSEIVGIHNWVFLPSWLVILVVLGITRLANKVL